MTLVEELSFWVEVNWKESDVPRWEPVVMRQLLTEAATRYATDWALPADNEEVA